MLEILDKAFDAIKFIIEKAQQGVSDEEILKRMAEPGGVGQKLIDAVKKRSDKFDDFVSGR